MHSEPDTDRGTSPRDPLASFHPTIRAWFRERLGEPSEPQRRGWPEIATGANTLIAAPTGSGKTLAAFLSAIDALLHEGSAGELPDETRVLYISPLRALGNDVRKNLEGPLAELRARDPSLPEIRVLVRSGDTPANERTKMTKRPPHILVTTPESLFILLTSDGGRAMLRTVRTAIVDEIHAMLGDKRGAHLALSLERLDRLVATSPLGVRASGPQTGGEPDSFAIARDPPPTSTPSSLGARASGPQTGSEPNPAPIAAAPASLMPPSPLGARASGPLPAGEPNPTPLPAAAPPPRAPHLQRIGLSATQNPIEAVARFLVGPERDCRTIDIGHRRALDIALEVPASPLSAVCSHEVWDEIYDRIVEHIEAHRTTLIFTGTRKLAERVSARLQDRLGEESVTCHHSSLSKERRLDAETRLKEGKLRALVATASLELGIDIGDVDLVVQVGATRSIATFLQRVGRSGHTLAATPKGRILPLTVSELVDSAAILRAVRRGILDRTPQPAAPLDILAQQVIAACAAETFDEDDLYALARSAWPYRDLDRARFDAVLALHASGRHALLHRDGVHRRVRGTRRARLTAITSGGAIPDRADYRVLLEPESTFIGTIDEDFAIEASAGDIFQLGSTSWQIRRVEPGIVHVGDAKGVPPTLPFWFGEAPARTDELSREVGEVREHGDDRAWLERECGIPPEAAEQIAEFIQEGKRSLGAVPTPRRVIVERFFDESGGQQMVVHAVFGGRINRAWGLGLRKKFCRNFGFELQAAANEDAFLLSLGLQHAFDLEEIFAYLRPEKLEETVAQAILPLPMFKTRWRWNAQRALLVPRMQGGKKVPPPIQRMRAEDQLAKSFPEVLACGETLPPGDFPIPSAEEQPLVAQTVEDCLREAMDIDGARSVLEGIRDGTIETIAIDVPTPSVFAHAILNAAPYAFLDDAPLEERRTQAVLTRRALDPKTADTIGALDPEAVRRVREEAWPDPRDEEELHEVLQWIGYFTEAEAITGASPLGVRASGPPHPGDETTPESPTWLPWLEQLAAAGRATHDPNRHRWLAADTDPTDEKRLLAGRLEALGPIEADESTLPLLQQLEGEGAVMRIRLEGKDQWCERRLLARIQRYTLESLREQIRPVSPADWLRFLAEWQHLTPDTHLEGPEGVKEIVRQLAGVEIPAKEWERDILPARVKDYRPEWLDQLTMTGEVAWGRLWGSANSAPRSTPIALVPREDLTTWLALAAHASEPATETLPWHARQIRAHLEQRGATFAEELQRELQLLPAHLDEGLATLVAHGLITNDAFAALRKLIVPSRKRGGRPFRKVAAGRWSQFRQASPAPLTGSAGLRPAPPEEANPSPAPQGHPVLAPPPLTAEAIDHCAHQLLRRYGVVFRRAIEKERLPIPWRDLLRAYRRMEIRGEIRGGRFVGGAFTGEQYALPRAVGMLRKRRESEAASTPPNRLSSRDPWTQLAEALALASTRV